jgi:hypothetical protein
MRAPAVAGMFYPEDAAELRAAVEAAFTHRLGPGKLPAVRAARRGALRALVAPHAGLAFSGPVAAHAYAALADDGLPQTVVLVGPSHAGLGGLGAVSTEDWATPLGALPCDAALAAALADTVLVRDEDAHAGEHSLEVQLPFLQWLAARGGHALAILPVVMGLQDEATSREVGGALARACAGRDVVLVASSDLMHAGRNYHIPVPRGLDAGQHVRAQDEHALRAVAAMDPDRLLDEVRRREVSMCGAGPVAAVLHAARALGAGKAEVLAHATSFDVQPHHSAVGYAAVALR